MDKNTIKAYLIVCVKNILMLFCFTVLSIVFNKWWIILFSILFWTSATLSSDDEKEKEN